jgi:hypothetical protein
MKHGRRRIVRAAAVDGGLVVVAVDAAAAAAVATTIADTRVSLVSLAGNLKNIFQAGRVGVPALFVFCDPELREKLLTCL